MARINLLLLSGTCLVLIPVLTYAASTDAVKVDGNLEVGGIRFSGDGSVITRLSDAIGPQGIQGVQGPMGDTGPVGPQGSAGGVIKYGKIAVVAKSGGDYVDPVAAMSDLTTWCGTTPSQTDSCLLKIMPGAYNIGSTQLTMVPYVDIEGSGELTTKITGQVSGSSVSAPGVVNGASSCELRFLTIENTGAGAYVYALSNISTSPKITHVTAAASGGGTYSRGIFNSASSPVMTHVTATASGASPSNYGIGNLNSSFPVMIDVRATATGATNNYGVYNSNSAPTMTNVVAISTGSGNLNYGVYNVASSPTMTNVTATASGALNNHGVYNNGASPIMTNVTATGSGGGKLELWRLQLYLVRTNHDERDGHRFGRRDQLWRL